MNEILPHHFRYLKLKQKYPDQNKFYENYISGDYYNRSRVDFYGEDKQYLEHDNEFTGNYS